MRQAETFTQAALVSIMVRMARLLVCAPENVSPRTRTAARRGPYLAEAGTVTVRVAGSLVTEPHRLRTTTS